MNKQRKLNSPEGTEVFCTTREAAEMLHVSLRTVQLWVEAGVLKAWKTDGGHRRLPLSSVQALIKERLGDTATPAPAADPAANDSGEFSVLVL
ncbi:MAG TPA: helix-turn-helix domain-containing protein, partial [Azonexus sp.]|nr:helix-turn-helix domain-containing protein [Azonexus sp.]